jgi:Kef-type K+ transport system membrane component KefB
MVPCTDIESSNAGHLPLIVVHPRVPAASGFATDLIEIHAIFGAFVVG